MKKVITYQTPEVTVFTIHSEGTLCVSVVDSANNGYEDDDLGEI